MSDTTTPGKIPINNYDLSGECTPWKCIKKALAVASKVASAPSRAVVDVVAVVPYALYYGSYKALGAANRLADKAGAAGDVIRAVTAPLIVTQGAGLAADAAIDVYKGEPVRDEGKKNGYINPLHSFLPGPLKGPTTYLPGIHRNGKVDWRWP